MAENEPKKYSFKYVHLALSFILFLASWTGIADAAVEWRESIRPMITAYISFRDTIIGHIPIPISPNVVDYVMAGSGVALSGRVSEYIGYKYSVREGFLLLIFWPFIIAYCIWLYLSAERIMPGQVRPKTGVVFVGIKELLKSILIVFGASLLLVFLLIDFGI